MISHRRGRSSPKWHACVETRHFCFVTRRSSLSSTEHDLWWRRSGGLMKARMRNAQSSWHIFGERKRRQKTANCASAAQFRVSVFAPNQTVSGFPSRSRALLCNSELLSCSMRPNKYLTMMTKFSFSVSKTVDSWSVMWKVCEKRFLLRKMLIRVFDGVVKEKL